MVTESVAAGGLQYGLGEILTVLFAIVAFIAGYVRLEGKTGQNSKDIEKLDLRLQTLESAVAIKLSSIERSLAKIEGRLSIKSEAD